MQSKFVGFCSCHLLNGTSKEGKKTHSESKYSIIFSKTGAFHLDFRISIKLHLSFLLSFFSELDFANSNLLFCGRQSNMKCTRLTMIQRSNFVVGEKN